MSAVSRRRTSSRAWIAQWEVHPPYHVSDPELMQLRVAPAERRLKHLIEPRQRYPIWHQQAPPHHRADLLQRHPQSEDDLTREDRHPHTLSTWNLGPEQANTLGPNQLDIPRVRWSLALGL